MTSHESNFECNCLIPWLDGAGQHSPGCAVFLSACPGCGAPAGYPPAGPCIDHGTRRARAAFQFDSEVS